jgi:hypothetical protein
LCFIVGDQLNELAWILLTLISIHRTQIAIRG